jgi:hypothetical protein
MANALPFGLRDVKLTPLAADGTPGTMVDLPASRTLSWTDTADFEELRGDDIVQAERENGATVEWDLEQGGISLDAYAVMAGGETTTSGVTPNVVTTYKKVAADRRPYFRIDGQVISDSGGDVHLVIYKAKATGDIGGEFTEGSFELTSASGRGYPDAAGDLYDIVQNETETAIVQPT